jgi:cytochrome b6-f complex iron-sulfur subunit
MKKATRDASSGTRSLSRRSALRILGGTLGGTALGGALLLPRCGPPADALSEPGPVEVPLADLPDGDRLRVTLGGTPVELRREGEEVVALSLLCTHFGCEVRWVEDDRRYHCPCHEGRFDDAGHVVAGPPSRPLSRLPARISGDTIIVGEAAVS